MKRNKKLVFTVTNDLNYDQRMIRICSTLADAGYDVTLIGFKRAKSKPIIERPFKQVRLPIVAEQGKAMYFFYWVLLFFYLLVNRFDVMCAIDLDTIMPVYYASKLKRCKRVYDAHEIFTELKEVISRPAVYSMWNWIARHTIHNFPVGYTIGECYADDFKAKWGVEYKVVRNATVLKPFVPVEKTEKYILYQGAVNVGRCFEQLIPAMKYVDAQLIICGDGNFFAQVKEIAEKEQLTHKVIFKGYVPPAQLPEYTKKAWVGITLFEDTSLSNRLSMANRFFDYMHYGVPQLCNKYPEYEKVNAQYEIASLVATLTPEAIADTLNKLLKDDVYYGTLSANCLKAREKYCWQEEAKTLLSVYDAL